MLVLTRKPGQTIAIDGSIRITVLSVKGRQVRLGVEAPQELRIAREEAFQEDPSKAPPLAEDADSNDEVGKKVAKAVRAS